MPLSGTSCLKRFLRFLTPFMLSLSIVVAADANAGTIVRVSTTAGDFSLELLDDTAPLTVQNFLGYVRRGEYNQTYIHRSESAFVVQGGGYRFQPYFGPVDVPEYPPIQNEFNRSNLRGTIAMAKVSGDPNSATSQWFVNLSDSNASLDAVNGGFTVFGTVLGGGMQVVDSINSLQVVNLGIKAASAPHITTAYTDPRDFIYVNMEVVGRFSSALNVFDQASNLLITTVRVNTGTEYYSLNLSLVENGPNIVFEANQDSIIRLGTSPELTATYSTTDNRLRIPTLELSLGSGVGQVRNVVLVRESLGSFRFILESFDP